VTSKGGRGRDPADDPARSVRKAAAETAAETASTHYFGINGDDLTVTIAPMKLTTAANDAMVTIMC